MRHLIKSDIVFPNKEKGKNFVFQTYTDFVLGNAAENRRSKILREQFSLFYPPVNPLFDITEFEEKTVITWTNETISNDDNTILCYTSQLCDRLPA